MKKSAIFLNGLILIASFFFVMHVFAQPDTGAISGPGTSKENPFVPCGGRDAQGNEQQPCNIGHLIGPDGLIQRGLKWVFMMVGFFTAILFMYAGFMMVAAAGNPAQINKAKGIFKNVIIGFVIILGAVLIIQQLLKYLAVSPIFNSIIR